MKWGAIIGLTVIVGLIALYEWPRMDPKQRKEKRAFLILSAMGWLLGVLLVFFPDLPSPTDLIDTLYKPLGKIIEK